MPEYLPKFSGGVQETCAATAPLTGGRLVTTAGAVAGANATDWWGVAGDDTATGQVVVVYTGSVQYLTASGAVTVGTPVKCAATGKVTPAVYGTDAHHLIVGKALQAATADGDVIAVQMER